MPSYNSACNETKIKKNLHNNSQKQIDTLNTTDENQSKDTGAWQTIWKQFFSKTLKAN